MRREFGRGYIGDEFSRIRTQLEDPLTVYLIGGGALAFEDLKDATKDIDIVVTDSKDLARLQNALTRLDYESVRDPDEAYQELGATLILENSDGCRIDIFNQQVVDKLIFSRGMQDRSHQLLSEDQLVVKTVSLEDVFLFKSVAGRTGDIEDMNTLIQTGLDFDTILDEIHQQTELLGEALFITHVNEALIDLEDRFGVTTSLTEAVEELSRRVYDQLAVLNSFDNTTTVEAIHESTELSESRVSEVLDRLEEKGSIQQDGEQVRKIETHV